jgi:catechol 2,3-dioxygenase-like lactoylglutathione lyase family enzyme
MNGGNVTRLQLALNVANMDEAIGFYSKLFGVPAKIQPGYANFVVADPPLKLVLIQDPVAAGAGVRGALNHLGVEVGSPDAVAAASRRFQEAGLVVEDQTSTTCCFAVQDKVWVRSPGDDLDWEFYTVLADAPTESGLAGDGTCCTAPGGVLGDRPDTDCC